MARKRRIKPVSKGWFSLATMGAETTLASAFVIHKRVARMATARFPLSPADQKEFSKMVVEKIDACQEAGRVIAGEALKTCMTGKGKVSVSAIHKTVRPFHRRAVANAKRLGR